MIPSASPSSDAASVRQLWHLYRLWERLRGRHPMPRRGAIDLSAMPALLARLMLLDVIESPADAAGEAEPPRFRYRLLGSDLVERFGRDPTGRCVDEVLEGSHARFVIGLYAEAWRTRRPALAASEYLSSNAVAFTCHRLVLPLAGDSIDAPPDRAAHLLGLQVFVPGKTGMTKLQFRDTDIRNTRLHA
jgi:hypothetical protein